MPAFGGEPSDGLCAAFPHLGDVDLVVATHRLLTEHLGRTQGALLTIHSGDDERNPPGPGVLERQIRRVKGGRLLIMRGSEQTAGHGTTGQAKWWKAELDAMLKAAPRLP